MPRAAVLGGFGVLVAAVVAQTAVVVLLAVVVMLAVAARLVSTVADQPVLAYRLVADASLPQCTLRGAV